MKLLSQVSTEALLILSYPLLGLGVFFLPKNALISRKDSGTTVVFVERWFNLNIRHLYWKRYLEKQGFRVYIVNFPLYKGTFEDSAIALKKYIEKNNLRDVVLVGISSGGLTALLYLQEHDGWGRVSKFVSVASPFHGTWLSMFISYVKSGRELWPESLLVKKIRSFKLLYPEKIFCIRSTYDEMVPDGSVLPAAHSITVNGMGHNYVHVKARRTYQKIAELAEG